MKLYEVFFSVVLMIFIAACTKTAEVPEVPSPMTAKYLQEHILISRNNKLNLTKLQTPPYREPVYDKESNETISSILVADIYAKGSRIAQKYKDGISCYLWIIYSAGRWGEFETALPLLGDPVKVNLHSSKIRKGVFFQEMSIDLNLEQLRKNSGTGLSFIIMGKNSTIALNVPALYVQTFLKNLDKIVQKGTLKK
ncbi:MAG: hypothetical protein B5M52_00280 [Helicobacteraceae bacterium 4484_230]|nr:MAG: hypothetical protein B5M52_00280 [Helicobacteraceae bacterium 4484_230]